MAILPTIKLKTYESLPTNKINGTREQKAILGIMSITSGKHKSAQIKFWKQLVIIATRKTLIVRISMPKSLSIKLKFN